MIIAVASLLPVFLVIALGFGLKRAALLTEAHWQGVDRLCYFILFPAFIFKEIAAADFSALPVAATALAMLIAIAAMSAALLAAQGPLRALLRTDGPGYSSVFQGVTRWHTFIAFAVIPLHYGRDALPLAALAAAVMTPALNLICVPVIGRLARCQGGLGRDVWRSMLANPFLLSSLAGGLWNAAGVGLPGPAYQALTVVGGGALGLALLSVGAALRLEVFRQRIRPLCFAAAFKLLAMPFLVFLALKLTGVTGLPAAVAILCNAVPTGSGAYLLARQLGGDAPLMASILTVQVIAAAVTLPLVIGFLG